MKINYSIRNNIATASLFFFNDTATTEIYTLSLHDALPISLDVTEELRLHQGLWDRAAVDRDERPVPAGDRKSTRLNSSHLVISYAVFCLKKKIVKSSAMNSY